MELENKTVSESKQLNRGNKSYCAKPYSIHGRYFNARLSNIFILQAYEVASLHISQPQLKLKVANDPDKADVTISMIDQTCYLPSTYNSV
jgi:hypothetical protein